MSVKKKTVLLALMLAGVMGLSGCKTWDVVCDILAVGTTKVEKDDGPKVDLESSVSTVHLQNELTTIANRYILHLG